MTATGIILGSTASPIVSHSAHPAASKRTPTGRDVHCGRNPRDDEPRQTRKGAVHGHEAHADRVHRRRARARRRQAEHDEEELPEPARRREDRRDEPAQISTVAQAGLPCGHRGGSGGEGRSKHVCGNLSEAVRQYVSYVRGREECLGCDCDRLTLDTKKPR